jgi:putative ABC transporter-associated repeat protein
MRSSVRRPFLAAATAATLALLASILVPLPAMAANAAPGWNVPNGSKTASGAVVLNEGHIDIASLLEGGDLVTKVKDTTLTSEPVWRDPAQTVIQLLPAAKTTVPKAEQYGFLGKAGDSTWIVSQTQQSGLIWPGWSTEGIPAADTKEGFSWTLTDASGPGEFALYEASSTVLGGVDVRFNTRDGISAADRLVIPKTTHAHGGWAFSAEGSYCLAFNRATVKASGQTVSDDFVLAFAVGNVNVAAINPAECFAAEEPPTEPTPTETPPATSQPTTTPNPTPTTIPEPTSAPKPTTTPSAAPKPTTTPRPSAAPKPTPKPTSAPKPPTAPPRPIVWDVPNASRTDSGAVILNDGHVDIASKIAGGALVTQVKDTTSSTTAYHDLPNTVFQLKPSAVQKVPASPDYGFLGNPGETFWQVSQSQQGGLLWPGWSTEAIATAATETGVEWALTDKSGPGEFVLYESSATVLGGVDVLYNTRDGIGEADTFMIPKNTHAHGSWAFSAEGAYCLAFTRSTTLAGGKAVSEDFVLAFAVGRVDVLAVTPADCFVEPTPDPGTEPSATAKPTTKPTAKPTKAPTKPGVSKPAPVPASPSKPGTPVVWDVPNASKTTSGAVILNDGHVDIASKLSKGRLLTQVKDTTRSGTATYHQMDDAVFQIKPSSTQKIPESSTYGFLGKPGETFWQVSQSQQSGLLWPGWSTELIDTKATKTGVDWALKDMTGPGEFALYEASAAVLGGVDVLFNTRDGITSADTFRIPKNTHAHGSWAFSAEGTYCLAFTRATTLAAGKAVSEDFVLAVAVGAVDIRSVDPKACFTEPEGAPGEKDSKPIPTRSLTEANAGTVQLLGSGNGYRSGQLVTIQVGAENAGQWVSTWLHPNPTWLGWSQVGASGAVTVRLPADAQPGGHKIVVKKRDGTLLGWDALSISASAPVAARPTPAPIATDPAPVAGSDGKPVVWDVPNSTRTDSGAVILNDGHVDIASSVSDNQLRTRIKDTTTSGDAVYHDVDKTVFQLKPDTRQAVPDSPVFSFLGQAGAEIWQASQTQQDGVLWPGWSTELIDVNATQDGVTWALTDTSGPGEFVLYESSATVLGGVDVIFNTRDGITASDSYVIPKNTHAHGTWAFSAEGVYCLAFSRSATLASGAPVSDDFVQAVAVGRVGVTTIDPASCFTASDGEPDQADIVPINDDLLSPAAAGDLEILDAVNGFTAGQLVAVRLGSDHIGEWVSAWLHSTPAWLGWHQVDTNGLALVRLPADAEEGEHRLVIRGQDGELIGWAALTIVAPPATGAGAGEGPPPTEEAQTPPSQAVAATQCVAGATILSSGHIDYASRIVGGKLESLIKDGTTQTTVWREPSGVVMWLKPSSQITLPSGYSAVGAAGSTVWQIPQTQNPNLMWLGWNTESLNSGQVSTPVTWTLNSIDGPGSVNVYLQGSFGGVQSVVFGNGGSHDIDLGKHVHGNWAFSAEGIYKLNFTQSATIAGGSVSSDTETLTIAVGDVDPTTAIAAGSGCGVVSNAGLLAADIEAADAEIAAAAAAVAAAQAEADAQAAAAEAARAEIPGMSAVQGDADNPFAALTGGNSVPLLFLGLGVLLVLGSLVGIVLWRRQRRWIAVAEASAATSRPGDA